MDNELLIPVYNSEEFVGVPLDNLPEVEDVIDILKAEAVPLALWLDFSRAYLAQGRTKEYVRLLSEATSDEAAGFFAEFQAGAQVKYERIQGMCSLAAFHAHQARTGSDRQARSEHFARAAEFLASARKLDHEEALPHLGLGQLALAKGDLEAAKKEFERACRLRSNGRPSIVGTLALAGLLFNQKGYKEALELYRRALREFPDAPADVRLGLGACLFKLGHTQRAAAAYERVLELDPGCTQALLGLAVIRLAVSTDAQGVKEGSQLLTAAFQGDPENPYVLALLAHFCLQQGFYEKARRLAQLALERADVDALRAEALTILARADHALGRVRDAQLRYQQASQLDPKLVLPRFGLAQISLLHGETTNAASILDSLLQEVPGWWDALRILGRLYPRMPQKGAKAAAAQLRDASTRHGQRAELWEILGDVLAAEEPAGALAAYQKAIELYRKQPPPPKQGTDGLANGHAAGGAMPARLLNNAAVLLMRAGSVAQARELMGEALASSQAGGLQQLGALTQVTLGYNMARVREAGGELQAAEAEYKALLAQFPQYADCYLRLACVAKLRGDTKEALAWAQKAFDVSGHSADSLALRANLYLERRDYANAKQVLDELLAEASGGHESYGKLAMANLHFYTAPSQRKRDDQRHKAENHLSHALELYRRVLEKDPGNVYAANGIGCVLAESGHLNSAKEVFLQVQEASAATDGFFRMPDAWTNLANVYLAQEQYGKACAMYGNALRKFYEGRSAVMQLYLARAHYDADQVPEAKRVLLKALHLAPTDSSLRFDVALTMQEWAVRRLTKKHALTDPEGLPELGKALAELQTAHRFFSQIYEMGSQATGIDAKKLQTHINFIAETHKKAKELVDKAQVAAEVAENKRKEQLKRMEAVQKQREAEELQKRLLEEAAARAREAQAREGVAKLERLKAEWRDSASIAKAAAEGDSSKVAKGRGKGGAGGGGGGGDSSKRSAVDDQLDALFEEDEDDNEYQPGQDDSDAEDGGGLTGRASLEAVGLASSEEDEDFGDVEEEDEEDAGGVDFGSDEEGAGAGGRGGGDRQQKKKRRDEEKEERRRRKREEKKKRKRAAGEGGGEGAGAGAEHKAGRLKRRLREEGGVAAAAVAGLEDDVAEEEGGAAEASNSGGPAKRQRQAAAVLDDDESEDEGGSAQQEQQQGQSMADLFGSDDE